MCVIRRAFNYLLLFSGFVKTLKLIVFFRCSAEENESRSSSVEPENGHVDEHVDSHVDGHADEN